ncbi:BMP family ABC transporter substrate-binding protein [Sphaerotilus sp.]|uniref:BMP family ABC transporter substrate-binding protein n=1 Tax=Sphaerotilus sp. TaxID=2093942 RepID=UPI0034E27675
MYKNLLRALLAAWTALPLAAAATPAKLPLKVAFVYVSPVGTAGWTYQHNMGRLGLEKNLGAAVKTTFVENVAEGADAERVMRDLAAQGHQLIFATSFGYLEPALKVAQEFPGVAFEHMGGYKTSANVNTYNARFYEGRYLAGMVAGKMSKTGLAGYVAGFPIPEVVQGINAFTLGMRVANPKAQVKVVWLNTWFDPAKEREAAQTLINDGADMLTHHSGSTAIPVLAEENVARGVRLLGYQSDMRPYAPKAQLTSVTHHWEARYTAVAKAVIAGTWKPKPFIGGVRERTIQMAPYSDEVPRDVQRQLNEVERAMAAGRVHPFSGRLVDQAGQVRQSRGVPSDEALAKMDFFVQGVVGQMPRR